MGWLDRFNPEHPNYSVGDTGGFTGPVDPVSRAVDDVRNLFYEEPKYAWELGDYYLNGHAPDYIKSDGGIGGRGHEVEKPIDPPGDEDPNRLNQIFRRDLETGHDPGLAYTKPAMGYKADPGYQKIYDQWLSEGSPVHKKVGYEHDMNLQRQVSRAKARAAEARTRGNADFADYLEGLAEVMVGHAEQGRPESWGHYWPSAVEEFGEHHPELIANPTPRPRQAGVITARVQHQLRQALANPGQSIAEPPQMDWGPVMDSIKETGGYSVGDNGKGAETGYMISLPGTEETRPTDTVTPATEGDYHKRHWDQLFSDPDLDQGGWDNAGTFYTDLSRNDQDLYRTVGDAVVTDQLGIYDLNRGQTLDTYDTPGDDRDDYNPLMVSPGPVVMASVEGQPGLGTRERMMSWRDLESNMRDDVDTYGLDRTPGGNVFLMAMREFDRLAGPLQPGTEDYNAYERAQFPSPPIDLPEKKRRSLEKKFKQPTKESLDPNMLDDRIDIDSLVKNALSRYRGATPEQVEAGRNWYATARARAEELARRTGGDFSKAAAIIAAMSPQMEWEGNLNAAAHFLNTYDPTRKHEWRRPNVSKQGLQAWNDLTGGRTPDTPEDFDTLAKLHGHDDPDWAKEMAMPGRWDRAVKSPQNPNKPFTGTGLPTLGDNVLRAMNVYDSDDPRELLDYAKGGPKIHSFWRNFLGDESFATIDKHMLRALERGYGEDPLLSYGSGKPEVTREITPEDKRVNELEGLLGLTRSLKGDEQQQVPTGYNTYSEAIRRATSEANKERGPGDQLSAAQMQAIIWVQHKADMDAFRKRKSQEAYESANPGKTYAPKPNTYVPAVPTNGPAPDYYETDQWAKDNPYKGGVPRPLVPDFHGKPMAPDNIPDPLLGPEEMSVADPAPWADPSWSRKQEMPKAAGRWSRRRELLRR